MRWHILKTDPEVFDAVAAGLKLCEIRKDDRGYQLGDGLYLMRTLHTGEAMAAGAPLQYTGQECAVRVTHILRGPVYGLADGWILMSVVRLPESEAALRWRGADKGIGRQGETVLRAT